MRKARLAAVLVGAAALVIAARGGEPPTPTFQGWVEANFIFIGADEPGRIETLWVREGDAVGQDAPLFALNADLQKAAVLQGEATLANAQVTFQRAQQLVAVTRFRRTLD